MINLAFKVAVNAAALLVAANVVPEFHLAFKTDKPEDWLKVVIVALVFALVNSYLKPILKILTMPIGWLTLGLIAFVINAALLLGTAWVLDQASGTLNIGFTLGNFPPTWSYEAIGVAVVASIVMSVVATVLELLLLPRKVVGM
jgi:putative membrane protein